MIFSENRDPLCGIMREPRLTDAVTVCHIPGGMSAYLLGPAAVYRIDRPARRPVEARTGTGFIRFMVGRSNMHGFGPLGRALVRAAACAVVAAALAGCSLFDTEKLVPDEPADKLYNEGLYLLNHKKDPKEAAKKFEEVDRQHPYSEWARKSLIMSAFAYYQSNAYDESITAARRYISLHPGSPDAAYAYFLIGSSHFDQIAEVSRDQERTEKAVAALEEVVRKYPNTEYAVAAKNKIEIARDQLAGKEMEIGRWYMQRKDYTGAINRFKVVVTRYQRTRHVEEALLRLTEAYLSLGIVDEAQTSAAVLGHNFPDSRWYKDAYNLVQSKGLQPNENKGSWISRAFRFG
jgi:outer membrane protein assembly factor BamD